MKNWQEKLREDYELKKTFDLWAMNFGLKDATGHPPIWDSLIDAFQFEGKRFISDLLMKEQERWHKAGWEDAKREGFIEARKIFDKRFKS